MDVSTQIAMRGPLVTAREQTDASGDVFASLVKRHSRFVFRVAYAILRNVSDSEDAVQETFLRVYKAKAWSRMEAGGAPSGTRKRVLRRVLTQGRRKWWKGAWLLPAVAAVALLSVPARATPMWGGLLSVRPR